jgi:hypothetical protein
MISTERIRHSGGLIVTALVKDKNPAGNPWGSPFYHSRTFYGYTRSEAVAEFRDSLTRDGLTIARDA